MQQVCMNGFCLLCVGYIILGMCLGYFKLPLYLLATVLLLIGKPTLATITISSLPYTPAHQLISTKL